MVAEVVGEAEVGADEAGARGGVGEGRVLFAGRAPVFGGFEVIAAALVEACEAGVGLRGGVEDGGGVEEVERFVGAPREGEGVGEEGGDLGEGAVRGFEREGGRVGEGDGGCRDGGGALGEELRLAQDEGGLVEAAEGEQGAAAHAVDAEHDGRVVAVGGGGDECLVCVVEGVGRVVFGEGAACTKL